VDAEKLIEVLGRLKGEPTKAFEALVDYAKQGRREGVAKESRSLRDLARDYQNNAKEGFRVPTRQQTRLQKWSVKWEWQQRVRAWDEALIQAEVDAWVERRQELRREQWEDGERLRKLGREWLTKLRNIDEKGITAGQVARMLESASELQAAALGKSALEREQEDELPEEANQFLVSTYAKRDQGTEQAQIEPGGEGDDPGLR
jgi:hypothetical protein